MMAAGAFEKISLVPVTGDLRPRWGREVMLGKDAMSGSGRVVARGGRVVIRLILDGELRGLWCAGRMLVSACTPGFLCTPVFLCTHHVFLCTPLSF